MEKIDVDLLQINDEMEKTRQYFAQTVTFGLSWEWEGGGGDGGFGPDLTVIMS